MRVTNDPDEERPTQGWLSTRTMLFIVIGVAVLVALSGFVVALIFSPS